MSLLTQNPVLNFIGVFKKMKHKTSQVRLNKTMLKRNYKTVVLEAEL